MKSWDTATGLGWIIPAEGMHDLFVREDSILDEGPKSLKVDDLVTYSSRTNAKGLEAFNVSVSKEI